MEAFHVTSMYKALIDPEKYGHCAKCKAAKACPHKAITRIDNNEPSVVDATYCSDCIVECNFSAIILKTKLNSA